MRRSGQSTKQIMELQPGDVFVVSSSVEYYEELIKKHRPDLRISRDTPREDSVTVMHRSWIAGFRLVGVGVRIRVDHDCCLFESQWRLIDAATRLH